MRLIDYSYLFLSLYRLKNLDKINKKKVVTGKPELKAWGLYGVHGPGAI